MPSGRMAVLRSIAAAVVVLVVLVLVTGWSVWLALAWAAIAGVVWAWGEVARFAVLVDRERRRF